MPLDRRVCRLVYILGQRQKTAYFVILAPKQAGLVCVQVKSTCREHPDWPKHIVAPLFLGPEIPVHAIFLYSYVWLSTVSCALSNRSKAKKVMCSVYVVPPS